MQINAINSAQTFSGKRDNIDAFINIDDETVRKAALVKTLQSVDTQKHKKLDNMLNYGIPLAGGLQYAAMSGKGARLAGFGRGFAGWGLFLTGMYAALKVINHAKNKNENVNNFVSNHPVMTSIGTIIASYFAGNYAIKGGNKLLAKFAGTDAYTKKLKPALNNIKNSKGMQNIAKYADKLAAKTPSAIKHTAKLAAVWSPLALILGSLAHSINHRNKVAAVYADNYSTIKNKQFELAKRRAAEGRSS